VLSLTKGWKVVIPAQTSNAVSERRYRHFVLFAGQESFCIKNYVQVTSRRFIRPLFACFGILCRYSKLQGARPDPEEGDLWISQNPFLGC